MPISLEVTGGTATPLAGTTDQNGDFTAQAQIGTSASELVIKVTAKVGDRVLDEETVRAVGPTASRAS